MSDELAKRIADLELELMLLRASESRLQTIIDSTPGVVYVVDLSSNRIIYANRHDHFGYGRSTQPISIGSMVHPDDEQALRAGWTAALEGRSEQLTFRLRHPQGDWEWVETTPALLRDSEGAPAEMLLILTVVSERQAMFAELAAAKERFDLLTRAAGLIVYEYDVIGGTIAWSGELAGVLGYSFAELDGPVDNWADRIHPEDSPTALRLLEEAERAVSTYEVEYRFRHKDGHDVWLLDRGFFLPGADGSAVRMLGMMQDVSQRKAAEIERVRLQDQVIEAQAAALRELSTPLIPISDRAVVLPLIGAIDTRRAQQVMEALLEGIAARGAAVAIIDITGVSVVDTQVANALIQAAQAVKLLGAQVILTGIRPEVAQTLVGLGVDLTTIDTRASLQDGVRSVLRPRG